MASYVMTVTSLTVLVLCVGAAMGGRHPTHGSISNDCKNFPVKNNLIDVDVTWSPYDIKPNTHYSINGTITTHVDLNEVIAGGAVWTPPSTKPFYPFEGVKVSCDEIASTIAMFNVTCPIKSGTKVSVTDYQYFLPGTQPVIVGDFIVEAYLKDLNGTPLTCIRTTFTIPRI